MKFVEKSAKTIEEAIELALIDLNASREEVEIKILEKESKGILGIFGTKDAKVRVTLTLPKEEVKEEVKVTESDEDNSLLTNKAIEFTQNLLDKMKIEAEVIDKKDDEIISLEIIGKDLALVIGKRGTTLESIQYLTSLIVNKDSQNYKFVSVDSENYKEKRKNALIELANKMAEKAIYNRKDIILNPMNAYERRIIHTALQSNDKVRTKSDGKPPYRKVIIFLNR